MKDEQQESYHWKLYEQWFELYKFYFDLFVKISIWFFVVLGSCLAFSFNQCSKTYSENGCDLHCYESLVLHVPLFLALIISSFASLGLVGLKGLWESCDSLANEMKIDSLHRFSPEYLWMLLFLLNPLLLFLFHFIRTQSIFQFNSFPYLDNLLNCFFWISILSYVVFFLMACYGYRKTIKFLRSLTLRNEESIQLNMSKIRDSFDH